MRRAAWLAICLAFLAGGCGYGFRGTVINLPKDIKTIAIPYFKNTTPEIGIEKIFTDETIYQFTRSQLLKLVSSDVADVILQGTITQVAIADVTLSSQETSRDRQVQVQISITLKRRNGQIVWQDPAMSYKRSYPVAADSLITDRQKLDAIRLVAQELAERIHDRVFENF
jgi:S-methylmethionine-dependent homocysteine/selenocysteine methylase